MTAAHDVRHVFIVRVWLEPREIEGELPQLRGSVEHVGSGERRSVKALEEVTGFIARFLPMPHQISRRSLWPRWAHREKVT